MNIFSQLTVVVGRLNLDGVSMLGTAFFVKEDGFLVTPRHVISNNDKGLVILLPHVMELNEYQDLSDTSCQFIDVEIIAIDPIRDLAVLKLKDNGKFSLSVPSLGSIDDVNVGDRVQIFGYPHCPEGRRVLTYQSTDIGAKVLLSSNGVKSKHAVLNIQSRPGQSGSLIFSQRLNKIIGILLGTYAPSTGIFLNGINPAELNQTTQIISAEYIKDMF
ncbi:S1 family peptidase [Acinetobacter sp. ANC 3791]|uniref:S1 family peptidase n=1 Tax=Acinetobacter sp. ANC 3791 TaxID=2529836 RepID=UPI00103D2A02|nr:serine protease [Acinetobacter sp. ANC 3791]TCB80897.1 serine protease [Acinetobacter sp. ANC 3791]